MNRALVDFEEIVIHRYLGGVYQRICYWRLSNIYATVAEIVLSNADANQQILDVGCGPGNLLNFIARQNPNTTLSGIDPSESLLTEAARLCPNANLQQGVAEALPYDDNSFGTVVSTGSIHHWQDPAEGLREVYRILKPKGVFLVFDQAKYEGFLSAAKALRQGFVGLGLTALSDQTLRELMDQSPFKKSNFIKDGSLVQVRMHK